MPRGEHPNSRANLKKGKQFSAENAPKNAELSHEARRRKRTMRDLITQILQTPAPLDEKTRDKMCAMLGISSDELTFEMVSLFAQAQKAMKGDLPALVFMRDTIGEAPNKLPDEYGDDDPLKGYMEAMKNA